MFFVNAESGFCPNRLSICDYYFSGYMNMDDEGMSQIVTIPYRALSVFIPVLIIFRNLKEKYKMGTIVKVLWFYWGLLLLRFFVDFLLKIILKSFLVL